MKYLSLLIILFFPVIVFSQEINNSEINSRILPVIWFSKLEPESGDTLKIYSLIQNNSGQNYSGNAIFYVNNNEVARHPFVSNTDILKTISTDWKVTPGTHEIQVKITTNLDDDKKLVAYETDKSLLTVKTNITKEDIKDKVADTTEKIFDKTDNLANNLSNKLDQYKKSDTENFNFSEIVKDVKSKVLGASAVDGEEVNNKSIKEIAGNTLDSAWNVIIDSLKFLINNWKWSLAGLLVLYLLYRFFL